MATIDTISPSNQFTEVQKSTLNYFIQILSDTNYRTDFEALVANEELSQSKLKAMAMMLVAVGTSMGDVGIISWTYNNKYATPNELIYPYHIDFLNKTGFSLEHPSDSASDTELQSSSEQSSSQHPSIAPTLVVISSDEDTENQSVASRTRSQRARQLKLVRNKI